MGRGERYPIVITALVAGAYYMEMLDATVIATALPQMARSFGTNAVNLSSGMSAYVLALAVFIPISGWTADRLGARTVFSTAIAVFTASSVLCGFSNNVWQFTAARLVQGLGGAMMVPVGRLVVLNNTEKKDLMRAIACLTWPALLAPVLGPPLGGFITTYANWRWIFFINVPVGIAAYVLAWIFVPNDQPEGKPSLDVTGFLLSGAGCTTLMYGLEMLAKENSSWLLAALLIVIGLGICAAAVRHAQRHPKPLLNIAALKLPTFAVAIVGGSAFRIAINAVPFVTPLMFQIGFGMSAFQSGLLLLALFAGNVAMKPFTTPLLRRFGFRTLLNYNGVLVVAGIVACVWLTPNTPRIIIMATLFFGGLTRSMQYTNFNTIGFADVPKAGLSGANTFFATVQQMSVAMGIALGAVALKTSMLIHGNKSGRLTMADFPLAFIFVSVIAMTALLDSLRLHPEAGAVVSGRSAPLGKTAESSP